MRTILTVLLIAATLALTACGLPVADEERGSYASITDDNGRTVLFDKKPERIVVTSASFLEPLYAVGGSVVGRPESKTKVPPEAKDVPRIGRVYQIDAEKIIALKPDLVILNKGMNEKLVDTLNANYVKTLVLDMKSYEDVKREIGIFAALTGEKEKGEALVQKMDADIDAVRTSIPQEKKRVAIIHSTGQGLSVQLDGSIAGSIAVMLGWENTAAGMPALDKNPDAAPYSMETLVAQNPDIIFVTSMGEEAEIRASMEAMFAESPAWQSVGAIRDGRVYYLPQEMFLFSPGIEYPAAVKYMARLVYP
ncbi:ABC transporter substrate-binding protein [Selenomonas dianae]|uniref:ABC transporter substrate-binding protein n=1 Tax=Selenomonas dianae TaxID=135079 RepID=A0ABN0T0N1_9FIRM|nr:ABC transporter substrate-binding protein [Selenomonas dianae]WLD82207.1 ABC transporter substrate-binding protein [Selenomonas dianae]